MKKLSVILITMLLFISSLSTNAAAHSGALAIDAIFIPPVYRSESAFTIIPATVGGLVATLPALTIGGTVYVIGSILGAPLNQGKKVAAMSAIYSGIGTVWLGSTVTGAPFFVVEKTLYDLPTALFSNINNDQEKYFPQKVVLEKQTHPVTPKKIPGQPRSIENKQIIRIEAVDPPTGKCFPQTSVRGGVGKSAKPEIMTGSALTLVNRHYPLCKEKTQ